MSLFVPPGYITNLPISSSKEANSENNQNKLLINVPVSKERQGKVLKYLLTCKQNTKLCFNLNTFDYIKILLKIEPPLYSNSKQMSNLLVLSLATGEGAVEILGKGLLGLWKLGRGYQRFFSDILTSFLWYTALEFLVRLLR